VSLSTVFVCVVGVHDIADKMWGFRRTGAVVPTTAPLSDEGEWSPAKPRGRRGPNPTPTYVTVFRVRVTTRVGSRFRWQNHASHGVGRQRIAPTSPAAAMELETQ
jgi:hypothetical protein